MLKNRYVQMIVLQLFVISLFSLNNALAGQNIPQLKGVQVKGGIKWDSVTDRYLYDYSVSQSADSTGEIDVLEIEIIQPKNSKTYNANGYIIDRGLALDGTKVNTTFTHEIETLGSLLKNPVIPVGVNIPYGWRGYIKPPGTAYWGGIKPKTLILPGASLDGFELVTEGIPGIRSYHVQAAFIYVVQGETGVDDINQMNQIQKDITVTGQTVGPTAPPVPFVPVDFVTYIIDLKHQAQTLGWVGGPGFVLELDKKLDQIKEKLVAGQIEPAREELGAFIEKVEAHYKEAKEQEKVKAGETREKFITSEGYALLKFNAAYLRDQLGKPKEMGDDKGQKK